MNKACASVTENDLAVEIKDPGDIFQFSYNGEEPVPDWQTRYESLGFDFKREYKPFIEIRPFEEQLFKEVDQALSFDELQVNIIILDIDLGIRRVIHRGPVEGKLERIDVSLIDPLRPELAYTGGFEITCFFSRKSSLSENNGSVWHKSQVIFIKTFKVAAKKSEGDLFPLRYKKLDKKVFYYIQWISANVSYEPSENCFEVIVNEDYQDNFKKLENDRRFGPVAVSLIVSDMIREVTLQTLRYAVLDVECEDHSLQMQIKEIVEKNGGNFHELATKVQDDDDPLESLQVVSDVNMLVQKQAGLGEDFHDMQLGRGK